MSAPRDELTARVRALEAERARPEGRHGRGEPTVEDLLRRLIEALHALWKTPPDSVDNSVGVLCEDCKERRPAALEITQEITDRTE